MSKVYLDRMRHPKAMTLGRRLLAKLLALATVLRPDAN